MVRQEYQQAMYTHQLETDEALAERTEAAAAAQQLALSQLKERLGRERLEELKEQKAAMAEERAAALEKQKEALEARTEKKLGEAQVLFSLPAVLFEHSREISRTFERRRQSNRARASRNVVRVYYSGPRPTGNVPGLGQATSGR